VSSIAVRSPGRDRIAVPDATPGLVWGGPTGNTYPTALVRAESVIAEALAPLASLTTPHRFHSLVIDMARSQVRADLAHEALEQVRRRYALLRGAFLSAVGLTGAG
jgi:hypothetical protein